MWSLPVPFFQLGFGIYLAIEGGISWDFWKSVDTFYKHLNPCACVPVSNLGDTIQMIRLD